MKLHYSQTVRSPDTVALSFQYLMKLHYSQTLCSFDLAYRSVSVPYEITLLSNLGFVCLSKSQFQYLMKLHYSQTVGDKMTDISRFQYLMKLHYSQTYSRLQGQHEKFQYLMKLHYSQTNYYSSKRSCCFSTL